MEKINTSPILKYGIYLGVSMVVLYLLCYTIEPKFLFSLIQKLVIGVVPPILFLYLAVKQKLRINEGSLSFGEAFQTTLSTYILGTLIAAIFYYLLINFINPELVGLGRETLADTSLEMIEKMGGNVKDTDELREVFMEKFNPFSLSMTMLDWLGRLFFPGAILALILAVVAKKS